MPSVMFLLCTVSYVRYYNTPFYTLLHITLQHQISALEVTRNVCFKFILMNFDYCVPLGSFATTDQGNMRGTSVLRFSEMDTSSGVDTETAKALYQKGRTLHFDFCLFKL